MNTKIEIGNTALMVTVKPHGAELCSVRDTSGVEYIWQADPHIWGRHAPLLFPIVGQVANGIYRLGDRTFKLGQHGFARDCDFEIMAHTSSRLCFRLKATTETRACYPFDFVLTVTYELENTRLRITYEVQNSGDQTMPFSIGAHPGFSCAWPEGEALENYYLEFESGETAPRYFIQDGLLSATTEAVFNGGKTIPLTRDLFKSGALIFKNLRSTWIALRNRRCVRCIKVHYRDFPHMGIWAMPGAPYVCIEPWFGHADPVGFAGDFMDKPGIQKLRSGALFRCVHLIDFSPVDAL